MPTEHAEYTDAITGQMQDAGGDSVGPSSQDAGGWGWLSEPAWVEAKEPSTRPCEAAKP